MSITIEGYIAKSIFKKGDFKIYSFHPIKKYEDCVKLHPKYKSMSISGIMPDLLTETLYKIDVEYSKKGQYDNYTVVKIHRDSADIDAKTTNKFLESILSKKDVDELLLHYPNIIDMIIKEKPIDVSKLKGIKNKKMNKIKAKVIENFSLIELVEEYSDYGMTFTMMKNLYNAYHSINKIKERMENDPYTCLCKLNRVGFKTADDFIMGKYPHKRNSLMRARACIIYLLNENETNGNVWIDLKKLYSQFKELAHESISFFKDVILNDEDIYIEKGTNRVSFLETRCAEVEIKNILNELKNNNTKFDVDYKDFTTVQGFKLTEEQTESLKNICKYNVSILAGVGGSGKSFSVQAIIEMLESELITYCMLSPTGKSAKVLADYTKREAKTIHRGLGYNPGEGFAYNLQNKLPYDVVIVDEFSMIDSKLLRDLLRAIDVTKTKILFIGDPAQIPSVGVGNIAHDMIHSEAIPTSLLTKVFRYGEGGLSYVATKIRLGEEYLENNKPIQTFGVNKDYTFINVEQEKSSKCLITLYKNLLNKNISVDDIMVLTSYNKGNYGTIVLNNMIQSIVNPESKDKEEVICKRNEVEIHFRVNDRVMQVKNNYKAVDEDGEEQAIFNGDVGVICKIEKEVLTVDFDGKKIEYEKSQLDELNLSYCLTIHKSQGSSAKYVIMITPKAHKFFLDRNLLYVASSRAKVGLYHVGSTDVIQSSLRKSQNFSRNTFLQGLLEEIK